MRSIFMASMLLAIAAPAFAEKQDKSVDKNDPNKVVCKYSDEIGTRLARKKTCLTKSQWDQFERETRQTVQRVQDYKPATGS